MAERPNFPKEEEKVLAYWKEIDAFNTQLELSKDKPAFTFYDGPPFATGMPHYGHIAAGTIKVRILLRSRKWRDTPIALALKIISDLILFTLSSNRLILHSMTFRMSSLATPP